MTRRYRKLCQEDRQEIKKMLKSGCSITKIATTLGIHRDLIYSKINDNGQIRTSEYIASFSGGKDSAATIILAKEHDEPLDEIIFSEVMYSKNISGELPEHINFIKNVAFPLFETWGFKTRILRAEKTYLDVFYSFLERSKHQERIGKMAGFPMIGKCVINRDCKVKVIENYIAAKNNAVNTIYRNCSR